MKDDEVYLRHILDAIDMRNFLIREYFGVRTHIVWDTCQNDLPLMKELIDRLLSA